MRSLPDSRRMGRWAYVLVAFAVVTSSSTDASKTHEPPPSDWQTKSNLSALRAKDPVVVSLAIRMLGTLHASSTLPVILETYRRSQSDSAVAEATAVTLGELRDSPDICLPVLREMLDRRNATETITNPFLKYPVRDAAVSAIGEYRDLASDDVSKLLSLHREGFVADEYGNTVEHPPTSTALSKIGLRSQDQVDAVLSSVGRHLPVVFSGIHGQKLQLYAINQLTVRLTTETMPGRRGRHLEALRAIPAYTRDELTWLMGQLQKPFVTFPVESGTSAESVTIEAALLLGQILGESTGVELEDLRKTALGRLRDLADFYDRLADAHDAQSLPAWDKKRSERVFFRWG
jgi:hypothetical protein